MIYSYRSFVLAVLLTSKVCAAAVEIPIVGLDKNHQTVTATLSESDYLKAFSNTITTIHDSTLSALEAREQNSSEAPEWMLRDVSVGIGLNFTAGLGPLYNISVAPRVRMCFSNSTHPKFP